MASKTLQIAISLRKRGAINHGPRLGLRFSFLPTSKLLYFIDLLVEYQTAIATWCNAYRLLSSFSNFEKCLSNFYRCVFLAPGTCSYHFKHLFVIMSWLYLRQLTIVDTVLLRGGLAVLSEVVNGIVLSMKWPRAITGMQPEFYLILFISMKFKWRYRCINSY